LLSNSHSCAAKKHSTTSSPRRVRGAIDTAIGAQDFQANTGINVEPSRVGVLSKLLVYSCRDGGLHVTFRFNRSKSHSFQITKTVRPIWCVSRRVGLKCNHLRSMKSKYRVKGAAARCRTPPIRRSEDKLCASVHWLAALGTLAVLPGQNRVGSEEFW